MKLYLSATSPFSRLCAITALRVGREDTQLQFVDPWANPLALEQVNPFSQVPTLLTDDGLYLTNTLIICQHIDNRIWHGSRAAQKSGYAFSLMEQFVKYFSLIHKTDGVAQPVPHPHIERSLHALKRALPNAPALDPTSEDWEQYLLAVTLLFIARAETLYRHYVSSDNQLALSEFAKKPFMQATDVPVLSQQPATLADCLHKV